MRSHANDFLKPTLPLHKQYEVLRAIAVEGLTVPEAAKRFGYSPGAVYNLCAHFRQNPQVERFFRRNVPGRKPKPEEPLRVKRTRRILALRKQEKLSVTEIRERLLSEGMRVGTSTISKTLQDAGIPKLPRRTAQQRAALRVERAPPANCAALNLSPRRFRTRFGGLFLFAHDLVRMDLDSVLTACTFPGSDRIPAGCAMRSLLALKLWGIGRPRHFMPDILDEGPALFSGLNIMPKTSTLVEYSARVDPRVLPQLMMKWHHAVEGVGDCTFSSWVSAAFAEMGPQSRHLLAIDGASGRVCGCKWDGAAYMGPIACSHADFRAQAGSWSDFPGTKSRRYPLIARECGDLGRVQRLRASGQLRVLRYASVSSALLRGGIERQVLPLQSFGAGRPNPH